MRRAHSALSLLLVGACGSSSPTPPDAPVDPPAELSPEPQDPVSQPCSGTLGLPSVPARPVQPSQPLTVDVDGDGHLDLIYQETMKVRVELGRGNGTFGEVRVIDVPVNVAMLRVGDLDGDAHPDLVMTGQGRTSLLVALNDGAGIFGAPQTYPGVFPVPIEDLALADLDGDGRLDVLARAYGDVLAVRNLGSSFGDPETYALGVFNDHGRIAVGDVTADGRLDVIATHRVSSVSVLVATADGTFARPVAYDLPSPAAAITLGDFDEDGLLDVAVGVRYDQRPGVSVLLNQGAGVLGPPASFEASPRNVDPPSTVIVADVNGDGHLDVGSTSEGMGHVSVLLGTGTGQLQNLTLLEMDQAIFSMTFSDLDRDDRPDLLLANARSLTIHLNSGTPSLFEMRRRHEVGPYVMGSAVHVMDLDGDENLDLIVNGSDIQYSKPVVLTRSGIGGGAFSSTFSSYEPAVYHRLSMLVDLDNDSRQDLLVLGSGPEIVGGQAMMNNGDGTLVAAPAFTFTPAESAKGMVLRDIDGDGRRDLIIAVEDLTDHDSALYYLEGKGDGTFGEGRVIWTGQGAGVPEIIDADGDGNLDIVVDHVVIDTFVAYRQDILPGNGDGSFGAVVRSSITGLSSFMAVRDLDNDGSSDLIRFQSDQIVVTLGGANGADGPRITPSFALPSARFGDLDGDGNLDLVSQVGSLVAVYLGRGDGTFLAPLRYDGGVADPHSISLADVDRDGRVDLVLLNEFRVIGNQYGAVSVLHGRCL